MRPSLLLIALLALLFTPLDARRHRYGHGSPSSRSSITQRRPVMRVPDAEAREDAPQEESEVGDEQETREEDTLDSLEDEVIDAATGRGVRRGIDDSKLAVIGVTAVAVASSFF